MREVTLWEHVFFHVELTRPRPSTSTISQVSMRLTNWPRVLIIDLPCDSSCLQNQLDGHLGLKAVSAHLKPRKSGLPSSLFLSLFF